MNEWKIKNSAYNDNINYRYDIINYFISKYKYKKYLEIGVAKGENIKQIKAETIVGVDPNIEATGVVTHVMTSDDFFSQNKDIFDIIFIDGLHHDFQVDKDIINSLKFIQQDGVIILHDCNPPTREHATDDWILSDWNGTVWKSIVKQRCTNKNISINVVNIDWGCGIIKKGHQEIYTKESIDTCLSWEYFSKNKNEILNLITTSEFKKIY